jgi:hypothetical protein
MFAIIEDQERLVVAQDAGEDGVGRAARGGPNAERRRERARHERRIGQRREFDQPDTIRVGGQECHRDRQGEARLADPARTCERQQPDRRRIQCDAGGRQIGFTAD